MTLVDFINGMQEFLVKHPEAAEYQVIYSCDDEGNNYSNVYYRPSLATWDDDREGITDEADAEENGEEFEPNVVIIN